MQRGEEGWSGNGAEGLCCYPGVQKDMNLIDGDQPAKFSLYSSPLPPVFVCAVLSVFVTAYTGQTTSGSSDSKGSPRHLWYYRREMIRKRKGASVGKTISHHPGLQTGDQRGICTRGFAMLVVVTCCLPRCTLYASVSIIFCCTTVLQVVVFRNAAPLCPACGGSV